MPSSLRIEYAQEQWVPSMHEMMDLVAREHLYFVMTEAPPLEKILGQQRGLISKNLPDYFALDGEKVVGFAQIEPLDRPTLAHRGVLAMGILPEYRGKGLGTRLLTKALEHAKRSGIEKVELGVYTSNTSGIALYEKLGFSRIGVIRHFRKFQGQYLDSIEMEKFL